MEVATEVEGPMAVGTAREVAGPVDMVDESRMVVTRDGRGAPLWENF